MSRYPWWTYVMLVVGRIRAWDLGTDVNIFLSRPPFRAIYDGKSERGRLHNRVFQSLKRCHLKSTRRAVS